MHGRAEATQLRELVRARTRGHPAVKSAASPNSNDQILTEINRSDGPETLAAPDRMHPGIPQYRETVPGG